MLGEDDLRWLVGNAPEAIKVTDAGLAPVPPGPTAPGTGIPDRPVTAVQGVLRVAAAVGIAWLLGLPRRAGRYLFTMNDAEAHWRGWQAIELTGGLARQYRDARFDAMRARSKALSSSPSGCPP
jgi:hypothetical protein